MLNRITHNFNQGSDAWLAFRATHLGASEASAMLGISKQTTRTELLKLKHTGVGKEFSDYVQREVLDKGHRIEALARPIVEKLIGEDLSPVTASLGSLSASADGVSFMGDIGWENKQFNKEHFELVKNGELPEVHWPQCQQVIYVHGLEKLFFTISDGTEENTVGVWVYPDTAKQEQLINGWAQFEKDLAVYVPVEVIEKPKAQAIMALPALSIQIKGEVTKSNLIEFKAAAVEFIGNIKTELVTDEDFANAEAVVGFCEDAEKNIELTKTAAIAQTASIDELMRTMDFIKDQLRDKRLLLKKLVVSEKDNRKAQIVNDARKAFTDHMASHLPTRLQAAIPDFGSATKNKKTLTSMKESVNQMLVNSKIEIDLLARDINRKTDWFNEIAKDYGFLFMDLQAIIYKQSDDFQLLVNTRIKDHKVAEAEKAEKIKQEAQAELLRKQEAEKVAAPEPAMSNLDMVNSATASIGNQQAQTTLASNHIADNGKKVIEPVTRTQYFAGVTPTANELVKAVAEAFRVDERMAHKYLLEADFTEYKIAA